jgi:hypothetical protein
LRLEFPDIRKAMIRGIQPPTPATVSVARGIDFDIAHFTTSGIVDDEKYSLDTLTRHITELESYASIVDHISAGLMEVSTLRFEFVQSVLPLRLLIAMTMF